MKSPHLHFHPLFISILSLGFYIFFIFLRITPLFAFDNSAQNLELKYPNLIKKLTTYKSGLDFLSSKIRQKRKDINDLNNKIKVSESKLKKLKIKIKSDHLTIRNLLRIIFIIQSERNTAKLLYIKNNYKYFIIDYQLKTILSNEKSSFIKLIAKRNIFLKLKHYLSKEKSELIVALKSIRASRRKLNSLIEGVNGYIANIKEKYIAGNENNKNNERNKKDRLLNHKVIKSIRIIKNKINNTPKKGDIKFIK